MKKVSSFTIATHTHPHKTPHTENQGIYLIKKLNGLYNKIYKTLKESKEDTKTWRNTS